MDCATVNNNKLVIVFSLFLSFASLAVHGLRIPENPCPDVFRYYKSSVNNEIYGEAKVPYDGKLKLVFTVNASLAGYFKKADLRIQLVTPSNQIAGSRTLQYNVFFPFSNVIPKITQISYNDGIFCSGPPEPLIPGTPGVTNVWASHIFSFSVFPSTDQLNIDNIINSSEDKSTSDDNIPVKDPHSSVDVPVKVPNSNVIVPVVTTPSPTSATTATKRPVLNLDPYFITEIDSGFLSSSTISDNGQCGTANNLVTTLILGGVDTEEGQYPWLSALFAYSSIKNIYEYKCTANLISERHVITAARCVQYYSIQVVETADILIVLGKNDLTHWATNGAVTRGASNVQVHPDFELNPHSAHADIAVITLKNPVELSNSVTPICLWNDTSDSLDAVVNKMGTVAAWGADETSQKAGQLSVLKAKHVEMPVVSQFECLKSDAAVRNLTSEKTFCAGGRNGRGPCIGDSGAGFSIPRNGVFFLRGIASIALQNKSGACDLRNKYAIFCDVAKFVDWVHKSMRR